ncbi:CRISPR-associated protein Cas3 [Desulfosporosinus sp. Tol-M]|nr:CRISPR-associated protein Cas3 [Desulfosporosinus sp. Tol-M]
MLGVIPFEKCVARPSENGKVYFLTDHLRGVKDYVEQRIKDRDAILIRLAGLAGICHDLAKSHPEWQSYINGQRKRGPNHAPEGAFLFSYLGYKLLKLEKKWQDYAVYWLWLTRDIADHHGRLKEIRDNHWIGAGAWDKIDLKGLTLFIRQNYPEFTHIEITKKVLEEWAEEVFDILEEAEEAIDLSYKYLPPLDLMEKLSFWRELTTALIAGDRFHVSPMNTFWLSEQEHLSNNQALDQFCQKSDSQAMRKVRSAAQKQILRQLAANPDQRIYTLEMPTGYGKTITALKIATWLGLKQGYQKIVYVAPYLSILEQTSKVIEEAMDALVLEHHSLAMLETKKDKDDGEEGLSPNQLMMESWANSIICTSFQQWSKVLFPGKAQDVLRRAYLHDGVVIIDEPQIFAPEGWNVFLCGLEAVAALYNLRIIFLSATMPPFEYGLSQKPGYLVVEPVKQIERYQVVRLGEVDEKSLAHFLLARKEKSQAAILNTIGDAYLVYKELSKELSGKLPNLKLLHGMMVPLHKRIEIEKIRDFRQEKKNDPLCVVSTQIIEAGVDLSFEHIARALPILPSIVQAAGRVNRNFEMSEMKMSEEKIGTLSLVSFLREGKNKTRGYIYASGLQKLTDELLKEKEVWLESEMLQLIKVYYQRMFERNSFETGKQAIADAFEGNWPALSGFQPFGEDYPKLPVFVPWQVKQEDERWLPEKFIKLQDRLALYSPESIYEQYEDKKYLTGLSFERRKEFMILLNHFVVNVPAKLAFSLVDREIYHQNKIPMLLGMENYDHVVGLAKRYMEGFDNFF